jgi:hypothetical protein
MKATPRWVLKRAKPFVALTRVLLGGSLMQTEWRFVGGSTTLDGAETLAKKATPHVWVWWGRRDAAAKLMGYRPRKVRI